MCQQKIQAGFLLNMVIASSYELTIDGMSIGSVDIDNLLPLSRKRKATPKGFSVDALWAHVFFGKGANFWHMIMIHKHKTLR